MKRPAILLLILTAFFSFQLNAQSNGASLPQQHADTGVQLSDAERIRVLEARVTQLENLVKTLLATNETEHRDKHEEAREADAAPEPVSAATSLAPSSLAPSSLAPSSVTPHPDSASESAPASRPGTRIERAKAQSQELLPSLGRIGASAFFDGGSNSGPFTLNRGSYFGGGLSLPIAIVPHGRLNYEVSVGVAQNSRNLPITSNVAQLINLSILNAVYPNGGIANVQQALTGTGSAPFNVTVPANWRAQTLKVAPLSLRYDFIGWDKYHLRPYAVAGLGAYVTISNQVTTSALRENANLPPAVLNLIESYFATNSPLSGALLGGQIATAAELKASGIPAGQGGVDIGMLFGGGLEWRIRPAFSIAIDDRYDYAPSGTRYNLTVSRIGWHF